MRAKPFVVTAFALSTAVAAFALLNASQQKSSAAIPTEQVLAASSELPAGTLLRAQDITWQSVATPEGDQIRRPSGAAVEAKPEIVEETAATVYGAVLRHRLPAGEPIRRSDFVKPGDRDFLQVVLSPGQRAIAIPVSTGGASTGLLSPGDRVDVILTQNFKNDSNQDIKNTPLTRRSVGETIARNVRVLAIDAPDTKVNTANGGFGRTVTLEVSPERAQDINVAVELGKLSLTLRNTAPAADVVESINPRWAGDVSPALFAAPQAKPTAITPRPLTVMRGSSTTSIEAVKSRETVKDEDK